MIQFAECKICGLSYPSINKLCPLCIQQLGSTKLSQRWWDKIFTIEMLIKALEYGLLISTNFIIMRHMSYTFTEIMVQSVALGWFARRITGRA